ncbi:MAG: tetratricopeptide repeat protein, partial [Proteobacteria bacterium]
GDRKAALGLLQNLYLAEPDSVQVANEFAFALCECNLWSMASEHLVKIVGKFPFDARSKHLLARCAMQSGDFSKAQSYLEQASLLSPYNVSRLCDLAEVFLNQYELDQALGSFRQALELDPDCSPARQGELQCELLLGTANDALKLLRQLEDPSQFASVFNGAAIIAVRTGHFQQGIKLYQSAVSQLSAHPDLSSRVFFNMGLGLYKWGKRKLAVQAFDRAVELDAGNDKAIHNAKALSEKYGRPEGLKEDEYFDDDDLFEQAIA